MTPEQLQAVGPSAVAILIAVLGIIQQFFNRRADDKRLREQREADDVRSRELRESDDARWREQRTSDEARWRAQLEEEREKSATAHARAQDHKKQEAGDQSSRERSERLRTEAAEFVSIFGEALAFLSGFVDNDIIGDPPELDDLKGRLSVSTARVRLISPGSGERASLAHASILTAFASLRDNPGYLKFNLQDADAGLVAFTTAVTEEIYERKSVLVQ